MRLPRHVPRRVVRGVRDLVRPVHDDGVLARVVLAVVRPVPVDRIVFGQIRAALSRARVLVDVDELQRGVVVREAEREAADAAEA